MLISYLARVAGAQARVRAFRTETGNVGRDITDVAA